MKNINDTNTSENEDSYESNFYRESIKENNKEIRKNQLNYCKNPSEFMNLLLEEHFKKNLIHNDEELKLLVKEDFDKFQNQLIQDFSLFKNRQKVFLEKLRDKFFLLNRKKNNLEILEENAELKSEPLYQGENIKNIFIEIPKNKYNLVINSAGDTKNELINNNETKFHKDKLCQNIIECIGNTNPKNKKNFNPPKNQFFEVKNIKNIDSYHKVKKEFKEKRKNEIEKKEYHDKIIKDETKNIDFQNKLFDTKYNNNLEVINKYKNNDEESLKILGDIKQKMTKDNLFDQLTNKKLNFFKKSEKDMYLILEDRDNKFNFDKYFNEENEEDKEEYLKKLNEIKDKYEKDYNDLNDKINKIRNKYKNKNYNKNKKRNKSSYVTNRIYYNDNPNHYQYNYNRASIPIKKKLNRYL